MLDKQTMPDDESFAFRDFLKRGLTQFGISAAGAGPRQATKPTPHDLLGRRKKIQTNYYPLAEAGYRTIEKIGRLIDNALRRPVKLRTAQLATFALDTSLAAQQWRREHGISSGPWYQEKRALEKAGKVWASTPWPKQPPDDPKERAIAAIHPGAVAYVAESIVDDLFARKFLTERERAGAKKAIATGLRRHSVKWGDAFVNWVRQGEWYRDVRVVEKEVMQPEGVPTSTTVITSYKRGEADAGREATHSEFIRAVLFDADVYRKNKIATGELSD